MSTFFISKLHTTWPEDNSLIREDSKGAPLSKELVLSQSNGSNGDVVNHIAEQAPQKAWRASQMSFVRQSQCMYPLGQDENCEQIAVLYVVILALFIRNLAQ